MRTKADNVLDIVAGVVIGLTIFILLYTAAHLHHAAKAADAKPNAFPTQPADWAVVSCDPTRSRQHRAPCGLQPNESTEEMN